MTAAVVYKADLHAADRIIKAACARAVTLIRAGRDPREVLTVAGGAAELLIGGGGRG